MRMSGLNVVATVVGMATLALAARVSPAEAYRFGPLQLPAPPAAEVAGGAHAVASGTSATVYTGVANAFGELYLLEPIPPLFDDVITLNGAEQRINDYVNFPGTSLAGQRRFVRASAAANGDGSTTDTFHFRCADAVGAPADLWPQNLVDAGTGAPLGNGSVGVGLAMPDALGGFKPVALQPGTTITGLTVEVISNGVSGGQVVLPVEGFFFPSPSNWNGQLGLVAFSAANGTAVDSEIFLRITSVPEPSAFAALAAAAGAVLLARRPRA